MQTAFSSTQILLQSKRGWKNLNDIAQALTMEKAFDKNSAISLSKLGRLVGMDTSHVSRLITGKVGFVRVYEQTPGSEPRSKGVYFQLNPVGMAAAEQGFYYPKDLTSIANAGNVLSAVIDVKEPVKVVLQKPTPEPYINALAHMAGVDCDNVVVMPVTMNPTDATIRSLVNSLSDNQGELHDTFNAVLVNINELPDADLETAMKLFARLAWKATTYYYTCKVESERREIR